MSINGHNGQNRHVSDKSVMFTVFICLLCLSDGVWLLLPKGSCF